MNALDRQVGGNHYKNNGIQPIVYTTVNAMGPCEMNIIKYMTRFQDKNGVEDLEKVGHYIDLHLETVGDEPSVIKEFRQLMADKDLFPISPIEYCEANDIDDPSVMYVIYHVTYWRQSETPDNLVSRIKDKVNHLIELHKCG